MQVFHSLEDPAVAKLLTDGAVGIIPTDTVYGIVASAAYEPAVTRLYELKFRDHKPGTLIGASIAQFQALGIDHDFSAALHLWPGAVSIETPHAITYLHQGTGRQALRIPDDPTILRLLEKVGPLQTTSANAPGEPVAKDFAEAYAYFGDMVDFYVDGGEIGDRPPSTIIKIVGNEIELIREGAVKIDRKEVS